MKKIFNVLFIFFVLIVFCGFQQGFVQENLIELPGCCESFDEEHREESKDSENCCDTDCEDCILSFCKICWGICLIVNTWQKDNVLYVSGNKIIDYRFIFLPKRDFKIWKPPEIG